MKKRSTSIHWPSLSARSSLLKIQKLLFASVKRMLLVTLLLIFFFPSANIGIAKVLPTTGLTAEEQAATTTVTILVDDFKPRLFQGSSDPNYFYNRLNGDRGALNDSIVSWQSGQVKATVGAGREWGGIYESLTHADREQLTINFSAILPHQILPAYQSQITGITVHIVDGTPGRLFRLELKDIDVIWNSQTNLTGGPQPINLPLPALENIHSLNLVLPNAVAGDFVIIDRIAFTATTQIIDPATKAFVWSYGMLLDNWNPVTGLIRDKAKDASGEFDAIQSTGSLAAATALAEQLGIVSRADAVTIVNKISDTLLNKVPRFHGLLPHWATISSTGTISIVGPDGRNDVTGAPCQANACTDHNGDGYNDVTNTPCDPSICTDKGTEWSSVDTVIAAIGLLDAQNALGLSTARTEQLLKSIDWNNLQIKEKGISHGYDFTGKLIPHAWDTFGGESWLAELAYAASTGQVAQIPVSASTPPTANGSGFIDELAWLFVLPPSAKDYWGNYWNPYRVSAANTQITYYPNYYPTSCFSQLGLFGLSAAEVPDQSLVTEKDIYHAFGVGGRYTTPPAPPNATDDGKTLMGVPVVVPHYSAVIASLRQVEVVKMWGWLIDQGYFSPLNNVESLMFLPASDCRSTVVKFNDLKGSWNLALQTLGWGRYLVQQKGTRPFTWTATTQNAFLRKGYIVLVKDGLPLGAGTTGVFRPNNGLLYLKNKNETGIADLALNYGLPGDYPVVGDWDGNGTVTIGVYRNRNFYLRNSNTIGFADWVLAFGQIGDQPIAGDWNGDGIDTIGIFRPSTGLFMLRNSNTAGTADTSFYLGNVGDVGIAGDWNGDGIDTTGVFRPVNGIIFLKNTNETGFADIALNYGSPGDKPITGDWNNDGIDTIGVYRNAQFYLRNSNTIGFADIVFGLGIPGDMPIAGDWDGIP